MKTIWISHVLVLAFASVIISGIFSACVPPPAPPAPPAPPHPMVMKHAPAQQVSPIKPASERRLR